MRNTLVLGIGNRLMMDDGIGIYIVEELAKGNQNTDFNFIIGESDIDYCLDQIDKATFIIIIDTVYSGLSVGDISTFPLSTICEYRNLDLSPHNLHLFQALYQQRETIRGFLIGVEPYDITFNIGLSPEIENKWNVILQKIKNTVDRLVVEHTL